MWEKKTKIYLPGALGDNIMCLPYALSCAGITQESEIYPALELYFDLSRQRYDRDEQGAELKAEKTLFWEINLIAKQPYTKATFYKKQYDKSWLESEGIINMDYQRTAESIDMGRGDIMWRNTSRHRCLKYWCADRPWLFLPEDKNYEKYRNKIIVNSTPRYGNQFVTWQCLEKYQDHCIFVGTRKDWEGFYYRTHLYLEFCEVQSFVEMAQMIRHCAIFVGSQSFPACLAESMKANRIYIQAVSVPDLIPHGGCGNAVVDEQDFERTLELYASNFL